MSLKLEILVQKFNNNMLKLLRQDTWIFKLDIAGY